MAETFETRVRINRTGTTNTTITLDANTGNITAGNHGVDGDVILKDGSNVTRIHLDPGNQTIKIFNGSNQLIAELGRNGNLRLGGGGHDGDIEMYRGNNQRTVHLDGNQANLWMGGNGTDGDIVLFPSGVTNSNNTSNSTIHLDANAGDIILRNADCAEDFDLIDDADLEPGTVLVINDDARLEESRTAFDRRVAGVLSGAGKYRPGLVLDRQPESLNRKPVALAGKAYCRVDAAYGAIRIGDLLTSSDTPGHAMCADDPLRAFGAVIGKALGGLPSGRGMVPILVALQ